MCGIDDGTVSATDRKRFGEAFSFFFQFYADTSQLWHTIDPSHISSIDSDEGFQQGDPTTTALYCIGIQPFIKQVQQFLLAQAPALPLFFVDDGISLAPMLLFFPLFTSSINMVLVSIIVLILPKVVFFSAVVIQPRPHNAINKTTLTSAFIQLCFICTPPILPNPQQLHLMAVNPWFLCRD